MALLTVQDLVDTGLNAVYEAAAAGGDEVRAIDGVFLHVKNGDASSHTVTITSQLSGAQVGAGLSAQDAVTTIPAGEDRFIGPIPRSAYGDSNNRIQVSYDAVTSVTVAALKV